MQINTALLKAVIFKQGVKQWQICREINLSENYFSRIMHNKAEPTEAMVKKISRFLRIKPGDLL